MMFILTELFISDKKTIELNIKIKRRNKMNTFINHEDKLLVKAEKIIVDKNNVSVIFLQRRLKIGYALATKLVNALKIKKQGDKNVL